MEKTSGVYKIPCKVNGLSLKFIFDTGASDVSLSLTEALFMLKNGYLGDKDFLGTEYYRIANGDIQEGTKVNLKTLEVGNQKIYNVQASISHNLNAPLLFGQSALQRFGKFSIDYTTNTLSLGSSNVYKANTEQAPINSNEEKIVCKDIDGNYYKTIRIGEQVWMSEDLRAKRYNNGEKILINSDEKTTKGRIDSTYLTYDNYQYNWYAIQDKRKLCPKGWHIPNLKDIEAFATYLGFTYDQNKYIKHGECFDVENIFPLYQGEWWALDVSKEYDSGIDFTTYCRKIGVEESSDFISKIEFMFPQKENASHCRCLIDLSERGYFESGNEKGQTGDYKGSVEDYNKAIEINSNNPVSYYNRGWAKCRLKEYKEALTDFEFAIQIDSSFAKAYEISGETKMNLKDYKGAIKNFTKAIEINPTYALYYLQRGKAEGSLIDYKNALEDYDKAIELDLNFSEAYYYRGVTKNIQGHKEGGCLDLRKSLELGNKESENAIRKYCN